MSLKDEIKEIMDRIKRQIDHEKDTERLGKLADIWMKLKALYDSE